MNIIDRFIVLIHYFFTYPTMSRLPGKVVEIIFEDSDDEEKEIPKLFEEIYPIHSTSICIRGDCKIYGQFHDHCKGKTSKGALCKKTILFEQYCHNHSNQAVCFYPGCKSSAWERYNHCWNHMNNYRIYRQLIDSLMYRGSPLRTRLDLNILLMIIKFL